MCACVYICMYVCIYLTALISRTAGWIFIIFFLYEHYGSRRTHGLHGLSKNGLETTKKLENVLKNA